jgi:hypothetical protein
VKVVEVLGKQKAIDIFRETRKIEEDGGMMVLVCSLNIFALSGYVVYIYFMRSTY